MMIGIRDTKQIKLHPQFINIMNLQNSAYNSNQLICRHHSRGKAIIHFRKQTTTHIRIPFYRLVGCERFGGETVHLPPFRHRGKCGKTRHLPRCIMLWEGLSFTLARRLQAGGPPRRTRRLRAYALSPLGIRDTDRNAPQYRPRLGRSSRRRAGLPPSAAPPHGIIRARAMRRDGRSVRAWPVNKQRKERSHGKTHDPRHEERHSPRARMPTDLRPDGDDVRTRGLHRRERGEEPHALEQQGLRDHERGLRALRDVLEGLPQRRREEDSVQAPEEVLRGVRGLPAEGLRRRRRPPTRNAPT